MPRSVSLCCGGGEGFWGERGQGGCIFINHVLSCTSDSDRVESLPEWKWRAFQRQKKVRQTLPQGSNWTQREKKKKEVKFKFKTRKASIRKTNREIINMDLKAENSSNGFAPEINLEKLHKMAADLALPGKFILRLLNAALVFVTNLLARVLGSRLVRGHFHLMLSGLVLFGPLLSFWVSKYSIFANGNHYLYRWEPWKVHVCVSVIAVN